MKKPAAPPAGSKGKTPKDILMHAPQPSRYGTCWNLPNRTPTIARAMQLLELRSKPRSRQELQQQLRRWCHGSEGPWGAACGTVDEWIAVQNARDAYAWLWAQLPDRRLP